MLHKVEKVNKAISLALTITLMISMLFISNINATAKSNFWSGTAIKPVKGSGTNYDPYLIECAEHLAYAVSRDDNNAEECYKLTTDIYLNDISMIDWATGKAKDGYTPNQWYRGTGANTSENANDFNGTIDGDGHTVYGLYSTGGVNAGLIPETPLQAPNHAVNIYNLGIENAYISAKQNAAAFIAYGHCWAGSSLAVNIENSYVGENVTVISEGVAGAVYAFGGATLSIKACYSLGKINGETAGFVGDNWGTKFISDSYMRGTPISGNVNNSIPCENVYASDTTGGTGASYISEEYMSGLDVLTNSQKMYLLAESRAFTETEGFPILKVFSKNSKINIWNGKAVPPVKGSGTPDDPYLIECAEHLAYAVSNDNNDLAECYILTVDIYLNDISKINWTTGVVDEDYEVRKWYSGTGENTAENINDFNGTINGNGHIIYGLYSTGGVNAGLVPEVPLQAPNHAINIYNLGIQKSYISAVQNAAAFVASGHCWADSELSVNIENCYVGETVTVISQSTAGAIYAFGGANLNVKSCYSLGKISGETAGFIGDNWGTKFISNSYMKGVAISGNVNNSITCENVYSTDTTGGTGAAYISEEYMRGIDALTSINKMFLLRESGNFVGTTRYPTLKIFSANSEVKIWNGDTVKPCVGKGTEEEPYMIYSAEEFAYAVRNGGNSKFYRMADNIYLNDVSEIDWVTGESTSDYAVNQWYTDADTDAFNSSIDGDGYVIYGLYYKNTENSDASVGLIPSLSSNGETVNIKNIGLESSYIETSGYAAAFVSKANWNNTLNITCCFVGERVTIKGNTASAFYSYGGSVAKIDGCYSLANIYGKTYGLVGDTWNGQISAKNTYILNSVITSKFENSIICENVYSNDKTGALSGVKVISPENMKGLGALTANEKMNGLKDCGFFKATLSYPVLKIFTVDDVLVTIEFDPCGGELTETSVSKVAGAVYEQPIPTRAGYIFKAWYTDSKYTEIANNIMPENSAVYYAKWYKKYDVNNDDNINAADISSLRKALLYSIFDDSEGFSKDAADCNMDGKINIIDLVRIKKYLAGSLNEQLPASYRLVWQEEFSQENALQRWKTKELNKIDSSIVDYNNITVENDNLVLSMNYDSNTGTYHIPPVVSTADTMNFKYGYMEMRAKIPFFGKGEWPALWLLSEDAMLSKDLSNLVQTKYNSEIDIVENLSSATKLQSQLHLWGDDDAITNILGTRYNSYDFKDSASASDWNVYGIMWEKNRVKFYVNNTLFCQRTFIGDEKTYFSSYMTPILSLFYYYPEVETNKVKGTFFEENPEAILQMKVDYIRLYQNSDSDSILIK